LKSLLISDILYHANMTVLCTRRVKIFIIFPFFKNSQVVRGRDARRSAACQVKEPPPLL